jgi:hypothetical protein
MSLTSVISIHRLKWEWDALTTFNQFVASVVHLFHSKNVRSIASIVFKKKTFQPPGLSSLG